MAGGVHKALDQHGVLSASRGHRDAADRLYQQQSSTVHRYHLSA